MTLAFPSWSSSHMSKGVGPPPPSSSHTTKKRKPMPHGSTPLPSPAIPPEYAYDHASSSKDAEASSRSSSLAGRKRPRDSDGASARARRTKSVSDTMDGRSPKDREAFQRGLINIFVPNALRESLQGKMANYNDLLAHFLPTPTQPVPPLQPLQPLLKALTMNVSLLSPDHHRALVSAVLGLPWATGEERFVRSFVGWAGVLVSAHPEWTGEVVKMAVKGFRWQRPILAPTVITRRIYHARYHLMLAHLISLVPTLPQMIGPTLAKTFPHKREVEVAQSTWVRNVLEITGYCPELGYRIWGDIVDRMLRIDAEINNMLEDEENEEDSDGSDESDDDTDMPAALSASFLLDPFDLSIAEDVQEDEAVTVPEDSDESDGELDPENLSSGESDDEDEGKTDLGKLLRERLKRKATVRSMRHKLDGMLHYFFRHLQEAMGVREAQTPAVEKAQQTMFTSRSPPGSGRSTPASELGNPLQAVAPTRPAASAEESLALFQTLLNLFTRQILPTSATQHVPFLLFLCSSFSTQHTDLFLGVLVSQSLFGTASSTPTAPTQPISLNQRIAATVYIGSVVCRARFVTDEQAKMVMGYLLAWIDSKLLRAHQQGLRAVDELPLFYAVCQAAMLIFCFRWRAFTLDTLDKEDEVVGEMELEPDASAAQEGPDGGKWIEELDILQRAVFSDLNPLLGCNTTIVSTFAKVAHQTGFADCFSLIESNRQMAHYAVVRSNSSSSLQANSTLSTPTSASPITPTSRAPFAPSRQNSMNAQALSLKMNLPRQARQNNIDAGLDSYFPFDPLELPRAKRFIAPLYRTWDEVAVHTEESDDEEEDEEEEEEDGEGATDASETRGRSVSGLSTSRSLPKGSASFGEARRRWLKEDGGLSSSFEGISISPIASRARG